jgi:threonine aldolase
LPYADLQTLRAYADEMGVAIHLDGARIWNAHVATGVPLAVYGRIAEVMAVCMSKGLGAPVGSLMVGSTDAVAESRVWRKRMGGGMRQVGILAAAGLHALDHHLDRLADDHANARLLAEAVDVDPETVDTNIVAFAHERAADLVAAAQAEGVLIATVGPRTVRIVTHLDVSRADAERAAQVLAKVIAG